MKDKGKKIYSKNKQSAEDKVLWAEVTKNIEPLKGKNIVSDFDKNPDVTRKKPDKHNASIRQAHEGLPCSEIYGSYKSNDIDHRTEQRLRRGQLDIEGRLDLHGMNQNQAYDALLHFIPKSYDSGKRCVLIVTGKGYKRHGDQSLLERTDGVLKQKTPQWLNDAPLSQYVLNVQAAKPKHGGEGALYVLLRRNRE